jgi:proteasome activator subunit 4
MLKTFLPRLSSSLNSILATQAFMVHFLPLSHPQYYLPAVFKLWESFNSEIWDSQWLDFVERLCIKHLDSNQSDPDLVDELKTMAAQQYTSSGSTAMPSTASTDDSSMDDGTGSTRTEWKGIRKDVGIFTDEQWAFLMTKCLRAMGKS